MQVKHAYVRLETDIFFTRSWHCLKSGMLFYPVTRKMKFLCFSCFSFVRKNMFGSMNMHVFSMCVIVRTGPRILQVHVIISKYAHEHTVCVTLYSDKNEYLYCLLFVHE